jgi:hypothetical protein
MEKYEVLQLIAEYRIQIAFVLNKDLRWGCASLI